MEKFFKLKENNTSIKTEVIAGITTFIAMAYIIFVNTNILAGAGMNEQRLLGDAVGKAGLNAFNDSVIGAVFVATIISAIIGTLIMGLVANVPFAQAAGMGMNAFFTYYVVLTCGLSWEAALAVVFICGLINIFITITKIRVAIINAIPESLKNAIGAGIGLFIAIIGFNGAGLIVSDLATLIAIGNIKSPTTLLAIFGLIVTVILMVRRVKGAILLGIILTTIVGVIAQLGFNANLNIIIPENFSIFSAPPSLAPTLFKLDFGALFSAKVGLFTVIAIIISFSLVDTFDTIGTFIGTGANTGVFDEKNDKPGKGIFPRKLDKALFADATATSIGALMGTSNVTTYVESAAGISEGGSTGLTSVVTSICFFLALFISPLVGIVPTQATAPALIIVGLLMISSITRIDFQNLEDGIPAFFTISMMPFSYSIANGIAAGFIFYVIVKVFKGKAKEVHPIMYIFAVLFTLKFIIGV
ncbi:xanthine/uracil permease [Clostridium polyendosporum]|uniref:Xanthine/uracil permease n=1 Tax=Clostridium polyendosporum TaxID=69208 RepID=A0A919VF80_9CLOT|nr:NCS2 family permease [Clostridium polyendosporum]GIM29984.1 xanthine/uracil permease [Clostridium polyendosporum]